MKIRKIGSFIETPEIGYGCMGLSGIYGPADDEKSIDLIRKVVDLGITMIDSAASRYSRRTSRVYFTGFTKEGGTSARISG